MQPVIERPAFFSPQGDVTSWANSATQMLQQTFQQYGYRVNRLAPLDGSEAFSALDVDGDGDISGNLTVHGTITASGGITYPSILSSVLTTDGSGVVTGVAGSTNDRVFRRTSGAYNFGQLTAGMFPNAVVPDAALSSNVALYNGTTAFTAQQTITTSGASQLTVETTGTTGTAANIAYKRSGTVRGYAGTAGAADALAVGAAQDDLVFRVDGGGKKFVWTADSSAGFASQMSLRYPGGSGDTGELRVGADWSTYTSSSRSGVYIRGASSAILGLRSNIGGDSYIFTDGSAFYIGINGAAAATVNLGSAPTWTWTGQIRAQGWYAAGGGTAVETGVSSGRGAAICYDRTGSQYKGFDIAGSDVTLNWQGGGTTAALKLLAAGTEVTRWTETGVIQQMGTFGGTLITSVNATGLEIGISGAVSVLQSYNRNTSAYKDIQMNCAWCIAYAVNDSFRLIGAGSNGPYYSFFHSDQTTRLGYIQNVYTGNMHMVNEQNTAIDFYTNATLRVTLSNTGALRLHAYGAGTLTTDASGNVTAVSDSRYKKNMRPFTRGLDAINKLNPKYYTWNEQSGMDTAHEYAGWIAQDVQQAIPEAVMVQPNGMLGIQERPIQATIVNALQEVSKRLTKLEKGQGNQQ